MAETVVIDIEARYRDQTAAGTRSTAEDVERLRRKLADTETEGNKARASLEKLSATAKTIAKTTISIPVKILDYATKPLRGLINYATSLKGILTGIVMGQTAQKLFVSPTQYAETLKTHSLAFENLLGSAEKADKMIKDIQAFDEKSPFNTMQIIEQSRMLMTYKLANEQNVLQMIETIGDASMGVGAGDAGIERIVRALGQMKAKGKVSAEEMLQLSEVNISGWQYLADAYGVSTAEVQKLTEKNKIPVEDAINAILEGMRKDFGGMANTNASKTLSGVWGQITSVLENGPYLQWGKGLDEGAMLAATKLSGWLEDSKDALNDLGDAAFELGKTMSTYAAGKFIEFGESVKSVLNSEEFQNAETMGDKLKIAWDKVIAEPFGEWWSNKGENFLGDVAGKIGTGLGKFYKGSILTLLGLNADSAVEDGLSVGSKFAQGFLDGFDADAVWEGIKSALGRAFSSAAKIIPGGEKADTGSYLSAALLGLGASKLIGVGAPIASGLGGLGSLGSAAAGSAGAMVLGKLFTGGGAALSGGILGKLGLVGAAGPMSAGALAGVGAAGGAGIFGGALGLTSAMADFLRANETMSKKEKSESSWSGASKLGMVGLGAAIGTAILPGLGSAIGAGIGGLGAIFAGGKVGQKISDYFDGTGKIKKTMEDLNATNKEFVDLQAKASGVESLVRTYEQLQEKVKRNKLSSEEMAAAQAEMKSIVEQLAQIYPDLISQYDLENGMLEKKLGLIKDISQADRDRARAEAELAVAKGEAALPELKAAIQRSKGDYAEYDAGSVTSKEASLKFENLARDWQTASAANQSGVMSDAELDAVQERIRKEARALADEAGVRINTASTRFGADYLDQYAEKLNDNYISFLEARQAEQAKLDELMKSYEDIYSSKISLALNPEDLDLDALVDKVQQIHTLQEEIGKLTEELAGQEKGTKEYEEMEKKLQDATDKQDGLKKEVEQFQEPLDRVLQTIRDINTQFSDLGSKRLDLGGMGLLDVYKYFYGSQITTKPSGGKTGAGFAKGTLSAPPGYHWVGEEGPELMSMRGGERIYNANASHRMAELYQQSRQRSEAPAAAGARFSLGSLSVKVNAAETGGDAVEALRKQLPEIANELLGMIAVQVDKAYGNMPMRVEGITT